jgi:hypothetical protein
MTTMAQISGGMAMGTVVMTAAGALPVEYLSPGDRVITRAGLRRVVDVVVTQGMTDVVRIAASALGHGRPADDVTLAANQTVLIRDWRAKAMFGAAQAQVAVARLVDGTLVRRDRAEMRMFALVLDTPAIVQAGGMELACDGATVTA